MLNLAQITQELKAIEELDALLLSGSGLCRDEVLGLFCRQIRKQELRKIASAIAENN